MQFTFVFIPMEIIFSIGKNLFDLDNLIDFHPTIFRCELIRIYLHYLIIYINSWPYNYLRAYIVNVSVFR